MPRPLCFVQRFFSVVPTKMLSLPRHQESLPSFEVIQKPRAEGEEQITVVASRKGCRMSKRSMLRLFELKRAWAAGSGVALPGQLHSQLGCLLPWTNQQPPSTGTLVRGAGETDWWTSTRSVRPSSHAQFKSVRKHGIPPAAGKQAGTQTCRCVGA